MAGSIQGLTVIINGDATRLTKAMREARAEAGILRGHMSQLGKLLAFNPADTTLLTRRQQLLGEAIAQTSARLRTLRASYAELAPYVGAMTSAEIRQFEALQREITQTELRMAELRQEAIRTGAAGSLSMQQFAGRMTSVSRAIASVSSQLMMVSAVAALVGYASLKAAVDFESSFAGVRKTIIATEEEYKKLAADAIALSLVKPVDVNDINRIMELGGQLNIASQYLTKFAGVMADLSVSTDMGIEDGSLKLAQFINITNMAQNDVDRLGATIVDLGNNSATTEDRMMNMAMRIAGASSNLGMSAQNTLALAAALSAVGIQAEMGGNAIATVMNKINKDVVAENNAFYTWAQTAGMSAAEFKQSWSNDVSGTLLKIFKGMGEFRDEGNNLNVLLKDMGISYMRQVDTLQRMSRASDLATVLMARSNVAWEQNTALVREATQRYSTAESKMQMMKNSISAMGIALGQQVLPAFSGIVDGVSKAVQAFADMDDGTKQAIVGVLAFVTALGPAAKVVQLMTGGLAALTNGFMVLKTWLVLAAQGKLTYTNMTIVSTAATTGETAALQANGLATMANTTLKDALALAYVRVGVAAIDAAAAIGISTGAFLGIGAAAVVAIAAIAAFAAQSGKANDPMDKLSASYAEQQGKVNQLRDEYNELAASESATAEEIWRAQSALDAEAASLEANSVTVREFTENVHRMSAEQADLATKSDDAMRSAEDEAGSIGNLVDKIRDLAPVAKDSTQNTQDLLLLMSQLNMLVPELELSWDSATGTIHSAAGAWEDVADAALHAKVNASAMEQLNTWTAELAKSQYALDEASKNVNQTFNMSIDELNAMRDSGIYLGAGFDDLVVAYNEANNMVGEASARQREYTDLVKQTINEEQAYSDVLGQLATGKIPNLSEAVQYLASQWGVEATAEEIVAERERRTAEAMQETSVNVSQIVEEIQKASEKYPLFTESLAAAGISAEGFAQRLADMGIKAEDAAKVIEDFVTQATDGFNRLDTESGISLDEFMENMQYNAEASMNFADNLGYLFEVAGNSPDQIALIEHLKNGGVEGASVAVQQLADDAREGGTKLQEFAQQYSDALSEVESRSGELFGAVSDSLDAFGAVNDAASGAAEGVSSSMGVLQAAVVSSMSQVVSAAMTKGSEAMSQYASAFANGRAPAEARALAMRTRVALVIPDTYSIGYDAASGVAAGIYDGIGEAEAAANQLAEVVAKVSAAKLEINSPSRVMRRIYRSVGEGAALGITDGMGDVSKATELLATQATPDLSAMTVGMRVRSDTAASAASRREPRQTIVNNYNIDGLSYLPQSAVADHVDAIFEDALQDRRMR